MDEEKDLLLIRNRKCDLLLKIVQSIDTYKEKRESEKKETRKEALKFVKQLLFDDKFENFIIGKKNGNKYGNEYTNENMFTYEKTTFLSGPEFIENFKLEFEDIIGEDFFEGYRKEILIIKDFNDNKEYYRISLYDDIYH